MDVYSIRMYVDARQFLTELDREINRLEEVVKVVESEVESVKAATDKYKKLQELLKKFGGSSPEKFSHSIEITGLQIYIDPNPVERAKILEESHRDMVDTLAVLKKVREVAKAVIEEGGLESLKITVQYKNGIPVKLIVT